METLPEPQRLALSATLVALGVILSYLSVPVGPAKVFPFQHVINVVAGVLIGPWYAVLTAFGISVLRVALGTGTLLAFPGSMFGALAVGYAYRWLKRPEAGLLEPIGTVIVGGLVGYALIAGLDAPTKLLGFVAANPPSAQPYLGIFGGALAIVASFAVSSVPGSILGYLAVRALRRAGIR
ncbi:MAG: energy coupling factor transporter S component ThiW [Chloroflexi bacterium]|nr:energy coupling factor transporter S component ThiW [Chloroflexota bacterium]